MFNSTKICKKCGWSRNYDSNRDVFEIEKYTVCPVCGESLSNDSYCPNI